MQLHKDASNTKCETLLYILAEEQRKYEYAALGNRSFAVNFSKHSNAEAMQLVNGKQCLDAYAYLYVEQKIGFYDCNGGVNQQFSFSEDDHVLLAKQIRETLWR
eukprot:TRINITY_DN68924_c0_g1_i1.p1 TRINITY_DN68924_c0_g1~~TRINITY_DN68924_c0_g1_i1.p1  ORF type:complete len:104 (+),score=14.52 TRINITY_DN68924_c0_g1_i1:204-515(+)